ncbi:MAG: PorP/SprF family type IX secretion system membrane protein [Prolixibacteraceae bacterium]|nr:PorP/SprF family type IX secretion system membrane protein [Prolixibacteraceae bacterium]
MKNRYHKILFILFLFQLSLPGFAQDALMHTQSIMKQEFMNPAYSSFKDFTSINLMSRHQWYNKIDGAPETFAANVYVPVSLSGFGVGFTAVTESVGLREKVSFTGSLSHNLRINSSNYLAFGYGFGFQNVSYDMNRLKTYSDVNPGDLELNATNLSATLGVFYFAPVYFVGLSSNTLINKNNYSSGLLPGFDFTTGFMYRINESVIFRPDVVLKYYPVNVYEMESGKLQKSSVDPIIDIAANFLLAEKVWFGTSHRLGQAQTFSADVIVRQTFKFGYTFELGMGKGVNKFSSHGFRLNWNIIPKRAMQGFGRSERHNITGMLSSYLYR